MTTEAAPIATSEQLPDEDVVTRVTAGDTALFEILMRRHNQRMYRMARAILRVDDEVEDVLQQAYFNAYQHLDQFSGESQFSTWLTRIVLNEALGRRRKRAPLFAEGEEVMLNLVDNKIRDPEQQAASSELRSVLESEVSSLPDSFRVVFIMRDVEGLSTAETATCLGVSEDLVKTRLHRARTMLRDNLYRRAGVTVDSIFAFGNARCDRVVAAVMQRIL
ncbi:MAG TPA: RNA polymerase sigma factor [Rhodothermales bacterium]|nr:RNA polymerase sigma factor [Rhodothermales bacterium]